MLLWGLGEERRWPMGPGSVPREHAKARLRSRALSDRRERLASAPHQPLRKGSRRQGLGSPAQAKGQTAPQTLPIPFQQPPTVASPSPTTRIKMNSEVSEATLGTTIRQKNRGFTSNCLGADVTLLSRPSPKEADPGKANFQERSRGPTGNRDSLGRGR